MFFINALRFIFAEIVYLVRHPWTFNWIAVLAWLVMIGIGALAIHVKIHPAVGIIFFGISFPTYYWLKVELNRRRPEVMKRHHEHYYGGTHEHKQRVRYPKKKGTYPTKGPRRYRTAKEIDDIIKKITSK